jgi:hypothetical protein
MSHSKNMVVIVSILTMSVIRASLADNYYHILAMSVVHGYLADNYHHILTMSVNGANSADKYHHILTTLYVSYQGLFSCVAKQALITDITRIWW